MFLSEIVPPSLPVPRGRLLRPLAPWHVAGAGTTQLQDVPCAPRVPPSAIEHPEEAGARSRAPFPGGFCTRRTWGSSPSSQLLGEESAETGPSPLLQLYAAVLHLALGKDEEQRRWDPHPACATWLVSPRGHHRQVPNPCVPSSPSPPVPSTTRGWWHPDNDDRPWPGSKDRISAPPRREKVEMVLRASWASGNGSCVLRAPGSSSEAVPGSPGGAVVLQDPHEEAGVQNPAGKPQPGLGPGAPRVLG